MTKENIISKEINSDENTTNQFSFGFHGSIADKFANCEIFNAVMAAEHINFQINPEYKNSITTSYGEIIARHEKTVADIKSAIADLGKFASVRYLKNEFINKIEKNIGTKKEFEYSIIKPEGVKQLGAFLVSVPNVLTKYLINPELSK